MLFGGICLIYIVSSIVNYFSIDTLTYAMLPVVCFFFWLLQANTRAEHKVKISKYISIFTIIISVISILALAGLFRISGNSIAGRLQFTFQYANAAGIYFAAIALMMQGICDKKLMRFIPVVETALFLTRSIGAVACYFVGLAIAVFVIQKADRLKAIAGNFSRISISAIFVVMLYLSIFKIKTSVLAAFILGVLLFLCWYYEETDYFIKKFKINYLFAAGLVLIAVYFLFSNRMHQGAQTFTERLVQIIDGLRVVKSNPVFGIGPGNWQYMQEKWKSAQYTAQIIHSSFIQIAVDAGIPAFLLAAALIIYKFKKVRLNGYLKAAAIAILLHSILDFSLKFLSIDLVLIFILNYGAESSAEDIKYKKTTRLIGILTGIVLCICFTGLMITSKAEQYATEGRGDEAIALLQKNEALFADSYSYRYDYSLYLLQEREYESALSAAAGFPYQSQKSKMLTAKIYVEQGQNIKALEIVLASLEEARYDIAAYGYARQLIEKIPENESKEYKLLYNKYVQKLNNSFSYLATKLKTQQKLEIYH